MRLKLKAVLVFAFLVTLLGCEVPFENNARLLLKGQIFDENNQPISDANISVYVRRNDNVLIGGGGQLIGEGQSLADGSFSVITLLGRDANFAVEVFVNEDYSRYHYRTSTEIFTPTDHLIDLGVVPIKRKALFNLNITRTSPPETTFQYTIAYKNSTCTEVYINEQLNEAESFCFFNESFGGSLNENTPEVSTQFQSFVGGEVLFTYAINGQPQQTQTLIIDQPDYEFNFSY